MKIMVIGSGNGAARGRAGAARDADIEGGREGAEQARREGDGSGDGLQLVHYDDSEQAMQDLDRGVERYGWVLIDSACGNAWATAAAVNARHAPLPVAVFTNYSRAQATARTASPAPALCAVETTRDGLQLLRCALHRAGQEPGGTQALHEAIESQPVVFEYHAPCRKLR